MNDEKTGLDSLNLSNSITIGQGVTFVGSISARGKAFINGAVTGDISVDGSEHVLVHSTGLINGKLIYGELEIQKGGRVTGSMDQSNKPYSSR